MSERAAINPEYVAELERRLVAAEAGTVDLLSRNAELATANATLTATNVGLEAAKTGLAEANANLAIANTSLAEANARLERMLAQARHEKFGPRSEKGDPDQRNLFTEDIEVAEGQLAAAADAADKALGKASRRKKPAKRNKGNLPEHLERVEEVIEPESTACPCGCGEMVKVGEDRTERLDVVPAQFRVVVTVRPKYMCRQCEGQSHAQAPAPDFLVPRGLGTNRFAVHSVVSKFCDHLPFYRQSEIWRRDGIEIDRTMLANWAGRIAFHMGPVIDAMIEALQASDRLFATSRRLLRNRLSGEGRDYGARAGTAYRQNPQGLPLGGGSRSARVGRG